MSEQYGNSNKAKGRTESINKHPASDPKGTSDEKFSAMEMVDNEEHHKRSIKNMSAPAKHQASMPISDHNAYKRQSHAVKPSGPIQSFVGKKLDTMPSKPPAMKKPMGKEGQYDAVNEEKENDD